MPLRPSAGPLAVLLLCLARPGAAAPNSTLYIGLLNDPAYVCGAVANRRFENRAANLSVEFTRLSIDLALVTAADLRTVTPTGRNLTAVLYDFNLRLATATHALALPFLATRHDDNYLVPTSLFWIDQLHQDIAMAAVALIQTVRPPSRLVVIRSDRFHNLDIFVHHVKELLIPTYDIPFYAALATGNLTRLRKLLRDARAPYSDQSCFLVLLPDEELPLMRNIFHAALHEGYLNAHQLWVIPSVHVQPQHLESVRHTQTRLVTLGLGGVMAGRPQFLNDSALQLAFCEDAVSHLLLTAARTGLRGASVLHHMLKVKLSGGRSGDFGYNSSRVRVGDELLYLAPCTAPFGACTAFRQVGKWTSLNSAADITDLSISRAVAHVRLGVLMQKPFFGESYGSYNGFFFDLMGRIASEYQWTLQWKVAPKAGRLNKTTNTWDGLIGMLLRNEIDIAVDYLRVTGERAAVVDFSAPLFRSGYVTLTQKPPMEIPWALFLFAFSSWVWVGLAAVFLLLSLTLFLVDRLSPASLRRGVREPYSVGESFFHMFVAFTITKLPCRPLTVSARVFMTVTWAACLLVLASYTANLLPHVLKKENSEPVYRRFSTLFNNSEGYRWFFSRDGESSRLMAASRPGLARDLVDKARLEWPDRMFAASAESLARLRADHMDVFVAEENFAAYSAKQNCDLSAGSEVVLRDEQRLAFRRGFRYASYVNATLRKFGLSGELDLLLRSWVMSGQPCPTSVALQLVEVAPLFVVLGGGVFFAFVVALLEALARACAICCLRLKLPKLQFGKVYDATVEEIELQGIRVRIGKRPHRYFLHNSQLHPDPIKNVSATELGLGVGSACQLRYFGKDPISNAKRFMRETQL